MKIQIEPGTEKWLKWAKHQLIKLTGLREDINLPSMTKAYVPEVGTIVYIKSTETEDFIRITGSFPGGFLVIPRIKHGAAENTAPRAFIPSKLNDIRDYTLDISDVSVYAFQEEKKTSTGADLGANDGFVSGERGSTAGGQELAGFAGVFKREGVTYRFADSGIYPIDTTVALTGGAPLNGVEGFHTINGSKAVSFNSAGAAWVLTEYTIGETTVSYTNTVTTSFGIETTITGLHTIGSTNGTDDSFFREDTIEKSHNITFPISYAMDGGNIIKNEAVDVLTSTSDIIASTNTTGSGAVTEFSNSTDQNTVRNVTLRMPNGVQRTYVVSSTVISAEGSGEHVSGVSDEGAGTYTKEIQDNTITILYSDAAVPVLIYSIDDVITSYTTTGNTVASFNISADLATSQITRNRIIALIGNEEIILKDVASLPIEDVSSVAVAFSITTPIGETETSNTVEADFAGNPYFKPNRVVTSDVQFAAKSKENYIGSVKDGLIHYVFTNKGRDTLKTEVVNFVLNPVDEITDVSGYDYGFDEIRVV